MVTVYSTPWCGYCHRLRGQLERAGIAFEVVDIEQDDAAAEFVTTVNQGHRTVPTVLLPDGTALVNPSLAQVQRALSDPTG